MNLVRIIHALLPRAYRVQVLGDLQERGFRRGDVVSAVAGTWVSFARRQWRGPDLAGASESILRNRAEGFRRRQLAFHLGYLFVFGATRGLFRYVSISDVLALFAILSYWALRVRPLPFGREPMLEQYRMQLRLSRQIVPMNGFIIGNSALHLLLVSATRTQRVAVSGVMLVTFLVAVWMRDLRVRRELEVLQ